MWQNFYSFHLKKAAGGLSECIVHTKISYEVSRVKPSECGKWICCSLWWHLLLFIYIFCCQQGFCLIQRAGGVISCLCQFLCSLSVAAQRSAVCMGQCRTMLREVIADELFYLVLQNQECVFRKWGFSWIDLFLRMQQWWVSVKVRKVFSAGTRQMYLQLLHC